MYRYEYDTNMRIHLCFTQVHVRMCGSKYACTRVCVHMSCTNVLQPMFLHTCASTQGHVQRCVDTGACTHGCVRMCLCTGARTYVHVQMCLYKCYFTHGHEHMCVYKCACTQMHVNMGMYECAGTQGRARMCFCKLA